MAGADLFESYTSEAGYSLAARKLPDPSKNRASAVDPHTVPFRLSLLQLRLIDHGTSEAGAGLDHGTSEAGIDTSEDSGDDEDEYEVDPEYEQEDDGVEVNDIAEKQLIRKGKRPIEIDVGNETFQEDSDIEYGAHDSSTDDEDTTETVGEDSEPHKPNKRSKKVKMPELPEFNTTIDMAKPKFKLGLSFPSGAVFKKAVREYSIQNGKDIFFKKNDPHRVRAQCKGVNCPWVCFASKIDDTPTFVIKTLNDEHRCSRTNTNRFATSKWLSEKYLEEFKINEKLGVSSFVHKVNKDHVLDITRDKAYKAQLLATKAIEGSYEE
ncbi:uncharacterized protein LOC133820025 [Humulus lupulus]|uniref:uncharacterized protein LOC133820025 n=1 Tax=Humulus lupulus TaxID=3486 RepID=UPI002B411265|nr:uncharacterized protein LOC133820025 [Humulus lupulus]